MVDEIDRLLRQLADAPPPVGLDLLEADVMRRIASSRVETAIASPWRYAAVGIALLVGIGFGASSTVALQAKTQGLAQSISGAELAPSSLLAAS
jgi:hypothetical protein